jgi:hypothetical protein
MVAVSLAVALAAMVAVCLLLALEKRGKRNYDESAKRRNTTVLNGSLGGPVRHNELHLISYGTELIILFCLATA